MQNNTREVTIHRTQGAPLLGTIAEVDDEHLTLSIIMRIHGEIIGSSQPKIPFGHKLTKIKA